MDNERFEIIKKSLDAHIKSLKDSIAFYRVEKSKYPTGEIIKRVLVGDVQAYYAYRTMLEWLISDAALLDSRAENISTFESVKTQK